MAFGFSSVGVFLLATICILSLSSTQVYGSYGHCGCRGGTKSAVAKTKKRACRKAKRLCKKQAVDRCRRGYVCNKKPRCKGEVKSTFRWGKRIKCIVKCKPVKRNYKCIRGTPGGHGDPHLVGFDNSAFDFHGEGEKNYIIFGKPKGDLLVTKMRANWRVRGDGVRKTFFNEFGVQTADSEHQVKISLVEKELASREYKVQVELNGKPVTEETKADNLNINFDEELEWITVKTGDTMFKFHGKKLNDASLHHLDVEIHLIERPNPSLKYVGVLGVTLNRAMGLKTSEEFNLSQRAVELEASLRKRFEVVSLFPSIDGDEDDLSGVVRGLVSTKDVILTERNWIARSSLD